MPRCRRSCASIAVATALLAGLFVLVQYAGVSNPAPACVDVDAEHVLKSTYVPSVKDTTSQAGLKRIIGRLGKAQLEVYNQMRKYLPPVADDSSISTRAIVVELSSDKARFLREFQWLLRSWVEMRKTELKSLRTDILVFSSADMLNKLEDLGCTTRTRVTQSDASQCVIHPYMTLSQRMKGRNHSTFIDDLYHYKYTDSINVIAEYEGYEYDFIFRSDLDCFVTPLWGLNSSFGRNAKSIVVGLGYYDVPEKGGTQTRPRLDYVAKRLGLRNAGNTNFGTSWGGPTRLAVITAKLQVQLIRWLNLFEFTNFDRCCSGTTGWPNWHWGVLTLYAGHIAFNNLPACTNIGNTIDHATTGQQNFNSTKIIHMHVLHGNVMFSKSQFEAGNYSDLDLKTLDMDTPAGYSTIMAVSSSRLSKAEFKSLVLT